MIFKEKNSVKIVLKGNNDNVEIKGMVYKDSQDYLELVIDEQRENNLSSKYLIKIYKKNIIETTATRFQKDISESLKRLYNEIKKAELIKNQINQLEQLYRNQLNEIKNSENDFIKTKFENSNDIKDIVVKFKKDILDDLNNELTTHGFKMDSYRLGDGKTEKDISVYNIRSSNRISIEFQLNVSDLRRGLADSIYHNGQSNVDSIDWDDIAKKHAPNIDVQVKKYYDYAKNITIDRYANGAEKGYTSIGTSYVIEIEVNKDNYQTILDKFKKSIRQIKQSYLY